MSKEQSMQIFVSPDGQDGADGSEAAPVRTLHRARDLARAFNGASDVELILADGVYTLEAPLALRRKDGGQGNFLTTWKAAEGASPVISGGRKVTGWRASAARQGIVEADVPKGVDARQLWINGALAKRAGIELPRASLSFSETGITLGDGLLPDLASLSNGRLEINGLGHFTDRWSPVERVEGRMLVMRQPAWAHNNWGYDTLAKPFLTQDGRIYLCNSLGLLTDPGEWFLDPAEGKLFVMPPAGVDMETAEVVLPHLDHLLSISGTYDQPVCDLAFEGLRFSHTSWMGPSSPHGYANQQSGAFLTGPLDRRPDDALETCHWGCPGFETLRNEWSQIPAAVQVSAAQRISFRRNVFAHLGQVALGIGNNNDAHASGIGLGTAMVGVFENVFTDISGGAIMAGGVGRAAHHPEKKGQANCHLEIRNNRIHKVSQDFKDNSAILSTYVTRALILHNEISHAPYDAIDIGWGWGINDVGSNAAYLARSRRYYDHPENLIYDTPTTHRDVVVAFNRIHNVKRHFKDGGAIYNLSASPGTVIAENYLYDIKQMIGIYLDEGSRYITVRNNVVKDAGKWLNINTVDPMFPRRVSTDNRAVGNWHDTDRTGGQWTAYQNNLIELDQTVADGNWPAEALAVMENAGIEPGAEMPDYPLQERDAG
jgi:hypothetical protein